MQFHWMCKFTRLTVLAAATLLASSGWGDDGSPRNLPIPGSARPLAAVSPADVDRSVDPRQILQDSLARCKSLDGYEILFHVRERTGIWGKMSEWARIQVYYRRDPQAIKMVWLEGQSYSEALYVDGRNDNRLIVMPKRGMLGLPPKPVSIAPQTAVTMGKTLRPITDFGLAELIRVSLREIERAASVGGAQVTYGGMDAPPDLPDRGHRVTITWPEGFADAARQDIYISPQTGYPVAAYFWEPDGDLLAAYLYGEPHPPAPPMSVFRLSTG